MMEESGTIKLLEMLLKRMNKIEKNQEEIQRQIAYMNEDHMDAFEIWRDRRYREINSLIEECYKNEIGYNLFVTYVDQMESYINRKLLITFEIIGEIAAGYNEYDIDRNGYLSLCMMKIFNQSIMIEDYLKIKIWDEIDFRLVKGYNSICEKNDRRKIKKSIDYWGKNEKSKTNVTYLQVIGHYRERYG